MVEEKVWKKSTILHLLLQSVTIGLSALGILEGERTFCCCEVHLSTLCKHL